MASRRYVFGPRPRGQVGEWAEAEVNPPPEGGVTYGKTVTLGAGGQETATEASQAPGNTAPAPEDRPGQ